MNQAICSMIKSELFRIAPNLMMKKYSWWYKWLVMTTIILFEVNKYLNVYVRIRLIESKTATCNFVLKFFGLVNNGSTMVALVVADSLM